MKQNLRFAMEMLALRTRYAGPIAFVRARLSPTGYLGLQLTVGALVLIAFSWLFGGIAEDVVTGDPLTLVDLQVAAWFGSHVTPGLAGVMLMVSDLHGPASMSVLVGLTAAVLAWKRSWSWLMVLALSSPGGMLVNVLMKLVFQRARPVSEHPLQVLTSYSFPSGHVAGATLFYGLLAAMYASGERDWRRKVMAILGAIAMVALVALSRMVLGVHYLSDVLAAGAEGVAWLTLCIVGVRTYVQYREGPRPAS